ncbi:MAG: hypothetical protein RLZZ292_1971 [Bacteroidota bacterium]|jgi:hypothetical protein
MNSSLQEKIDYGYSFNLRHYLAATARIIAANALPIIGFTLLLTLLQSIIGLLPIIGFFINNLIVIPVGAAGFFIVARKFDTGEKASFGSFFEGFKRLGSLAAFHFTFGLFMLGFLLTVVHFVSISGEELNMYSVLQLGQMPWAELFEKTKGFFVIVLVLIALLALYVFYGLTYALVLFQKMDFWTAMVHSRQLIQKKLGAFMLLYLIYLLLTCVLIWVFHRLAWTGLQELAFPPKDPTATIGLDFMSQIKDLLKQYFLQLCCYNAILTFLQPFFYTFLYCIYADIVRQEVEVEVEMED